MVGIFNIYQIEQRIHNQRIELARINQQRREMANKIHVIEHIDYIKSRLHALNPNLPYRSVIMDKKYRIAIEEIFHRSQRDAIKFYNELLNRRNKIVHRFTKSDWDLDPIYRNITNLSLSELVEQLR